ncbi:hypothetical protein [Senimuribacter intestinalis]|uniref:hypothetical protein n=1 Tax=Senimuribacter intestinalis TaxID=2941507 RepID=UPI00203B5D37|nr:hypothetical protein [Senimuribacter intestinalis]
MSLSKAKKRDCVIFGILPIVSAGLASIYIPIPEHITIGIIVDDIKMMIGVWATLLGFLLTATSILLTMGGKKFIEFIKDTGDYKTILISFVISCAFMFFAILLGLICTLAIYDTVILYKWLIGLSSIVFMSDFISLLLFFIVILKTDWNRE